MSLIHHPAGERQVKNNALISRSHSAPTLINPGSACASDSLFHSLPQDLLIIDAGSRVAGRGALGGGWRGRASCRRCRPVPGSLRGAFLLPFAYPRLPSLSQTKAPGAGRLVPISAPFRARQTVTPACKWQFVRSKAPVTPNISIYSRGGVVSKHVSGCLRTTFWFSAVFFSAAGVGSGFSPWERWDGVGKALKLQKLPAWDVPLTEAGFYAVRKKKKVETRLLLMPVCPCPAGLPEGCRGRAGSGGSRGGVGAISEHLHAC